MSEEALRPQELMRDSRRRKSQQLRLGTEWKLRCGAGQELHPKTPFPSRLWAHARFTSGNVVLLQAHLLLAGARKDPELIIDAEWWYQGAVGKQFRLPLLNGLIYTFCFIDVESLKYRDIRTLGFTQIKRITLVDRAVA